MPAGHILYLLHQLLFREGAAQLAHGSIAGILEMLYGLITDIFKEQNVNLFFGIARRFLSVGMPVIFLVKCKYLLFTSHNKNSC